MIFNDFIKTCHELTESGMSYAVVSVIQIDAHVPQEVGAKMIVTKDGLHAGTIGGGKLEARGIALAKEHLEQRDGHAKKPALHRIDLNQDLGMVCGGVATIFIESSLGTAWTIALYGAGHVGQSLARLLTSFSCQVICADVRSEWLDKLPDHPRLKKILATSLSEVPGALPSHTYHVIATQGHAFDIEVLRAVLKQKSAPYIGVIGSSVKARKVRAVLAGEGFSTDELQSFHCPMGLPIGNNTPAEISVSIAAQLLQRRDQLSSQK